MISPPGDWYRNHWTSSKFISKWTENTVSEVDFLERELGLHAGVHVLDLACGQGRHSLELAARGVDVVGVDINPELIEFARSATLGKCARFVVQDAASVEFSEMFEVVLNLYDGAIGYMAEDGENDRLFAKLAQALVKGGKSVIHVLNAAYFDHRGSFQTWSVGANSLNLTDYRWDRKNRRLLHGGHVFRLGEQLPRNVRVGPFSSYRLYTVEELEVKLAFVGLSKVATLGAYDARVPFNPLGKDLIQISVKD